MITTFVLYPPKYILQIYTEWPLENNAPEFLTLWFVKPSQTYFQGRHLNVYFEFAQPQPQGQLQGGEACNNFFTWNKG